MLLKSQAFSWPGISKPCRCCLLVPVASWPLRGCTLRRPRQARADWHQAVLHGGLHWFPLAWRDHP